MIVGGQRLKRNFCFHEVDGFFKNFKNYLFLFFLGFASFFWFGRGSISRKRLPALEHFTVKFLIVRTTLGGIFSNHEVTHIFKILEIVLSLTIVEDIVLINKLLIFSAFFLCPSIYFFMLFIFIKFYIKKNYNLYRNLIN